MTSLTLEQAAYLAEVVAVAAVVISIFYLALQVRQGNIATNMSTIQRVNNSFNDFYQSLGENEEIATLYRRGLNGVDQLNAAEQVRFIALLNRAFRSVHEMRYYQQKRLVDDAVWHTVTSVWKDALQTKGFQDYWSIKRHWYGNAFQEWMENSIISSTDTRQLYPEHDA